MLNNFLVIDLLIDLFFCSLDWELHEGSSLHVMILLYPQHTAKCLAHRWYLLRKYINRSAVLLFLRQLLQPLMTLLENKTLILLISKQKFQYNQKSGVLPLCPFGPQIYWGIQKLDFRGSSMAHLSPPRLACLPEQELRDHINAVEFISSSLQSSDPIPTTIPHPLMPTLDYPQTSNNSRKKKSSYQKRNHFPWQLIFLQVKRMIKQLPSYFDGP